MINKERLALGIQALRSGQYPQGRDRLCTLGNGGKPVGYCCLGVLTEVAMANGLELLTEANGVRRCYGESWSTLPMAVQDWYGFGVPDPRLTGPDGAQILHASEWNDDYNKSLAELGYMFEYTFLRMFQEEQ